MSVYRATRSNKVRNENSESDRKHREAKPSAQTLGGSQCRFGSRPCNISKNAQTCRLDCSQQLTRKRILASRVFFVDRPRKVVPVRETVRYGERNVHCQRDNRKNERTRLTSPCIGFSSEIEVTWYRFGQPRKKVNGQSPNAGQRQNGHDFQSDMEPGPWEISESRSIRHVVCRGG